MLGTVVISRHLPGEALDLARSRAAVRFHAEDRRLARDELAAYVRDADGLACLLTETIYDERLGKAPRVRVVANVAVG